MQQRSVYTFYYGLFMDDDVLRSAGIEVREPRRGFVEGFALRIGERATLISRANERAYGIAYSMPHSDIDKLYGQLGLEDYKPEGVLVNTFNGGSFAALCFNLLEAPDENEKNTAYADKLKAALNKFKFPQEYISQID